MSDPVKSDPVANEPKELDVQEVNVSNIKNFNDSGSSGKLRQRLYSIDALRGFDMLWIVGGDVLMISLGAVSHATWVKTLATQFNHVAWEGFRFYDLIFPLFMFIAGAVIPFSILSKLEQGVPRSQLIKKTLRRVAILFLLGLLYNGVFRDGFATARYASVLAQIGISYLFAVLIVMYSGTLKTRAFWLIVVLLIVTILQLFVPVPGIGAGVLTPEGHMNGYIDRMLLPGRLAYGIDSSMVKGQGIYDALGILSTVSSIGIAVMGTFAGSLLRMGKIPELRKTLILVGAGSGLIILALLISPFYPIIKKCWTTTFNLLTGGISFILIALFYLVIDVWGWKKWSFFFRVIGMNSIFIYIFYRVVNFSFTSEYLFGWLTQGFMESWAQPIIALGTVALVWSLLYLMYRKKIFINV